MRLGLWLLLAAAGWAFSFWVYARRELPVRGRRGMAALRGGSISLVLLLILDPTFPGSAGDRGPWVILDTSPSMWVAQGGMAAGEPPMRAAGTLATEDTNARTVTFGSPVRRLGTGWAEAGDPPRGLDSRLAPALTQALEAGASRVLVLTDLRLDDPVEVETVLRDAPVPVAFRDLGGAVANGGVAELDLPGAARAGAEVRGSATLFGELPGPVRLSVAVNGVPAWDTTVALPGSGRTRIPVRFNAPAAEGPTAVTVRLSGGGDAHPGDDVRTRILEVDPAAGELVLVSWFPDWEPRFLLPVLEEVTGLRAQGYLRVGPDRFMTMNGPTAFLDGNEVAAALENARVGVAHGVPPETAGAWAGALQRVPRLLVLPAAVDARGEGGEWFLSTEVPASPLAGEVAGIPLLGVPPLLGWRGPDASGFPGGRATPVLFLQRGGQGEPAPAVMLGERADGARRVQALAHGFWRWGFRDGAPRELYRRLWSGVAGWLLAADSEGLPASGLAPLRSVVRPGEGVDWRAGSAAGETLSVDFAPVAGETPDPGEAPTAAPSPVPVDSLGHATVTAPGIPGVYRWKAGSGGEGGEEASGLLVVEEADVDLLPPRAVHLPELAVAAAGDGPGGRRPLRTHPAPYLLLLGLLTTEWVVRRRSGLR